MSDHPSCPIEKFRGGIVEIATTEGVIKKPGLIFDCFHVREYRGCWVITHLPTGLRFPANFEDLESVVHATVEIRTLREDWSDLRSEDLKPMAVAIKAIVAEWGEWDADANRSTSREIVADCFNRRLNENVA